MKPNLRLKAAILEVVETQLNANEPPETKRTLERLTAEGHSQQQAKELIGTVVAAEMFYVLKEGKPFNAERFAAALERLPEIPEE